jgi:plasmid stabilization system protein ParE
MTCQLEITPEAERDILAITANVKLQLSIAAAKKIVVEFSKQLYQLAQSPESGRAGGCAGTREIVMSGMPYIAIYEQKNNLIRVIRVLHGAIKDRS